MVCTARMELARQLFLNALIGLFSGETSGIVSYNGIAIDRLNMPLLRRQKISYVEQTPVMLNMPVKAFLNFGIEQSQSVAETQKNAHRNAGNRRSSDKRYQ